VKLYLMQQAQPVTPASRLAWMQMDPYLPVKSFQFSQQQVAQLPTLLQPRSLSLL
jgi:hypothetical protein